MSTSTYYKSDGLAKEDKFQRKSFSERLAKTIMNHPPGECFVVSISSEWGAGKSSVLDWLKIPWAMSKAPPITEFNLWGVTGSQELLLGLYDRVIGALNPSDELLNKWQRLKLSGQQIATVGSAGGSVVSAAGQGFLGTVISSISALAGSLFRVDFESVRDGVKEKLLRSDSRTLVILDDIDRMERDELMLLLRVLKRDAALPNVTYLLAMDEAQVARLIGGKDGEVMGRNYLEKIVQARLELPAIAPQTMKNFFIDEVNESLEGVAPLDMERFSTSFDRLFLPLLKTPRTAKMLANAIRFSAGMLPGEVDTTDLVLLESARLLFPELYERIRDASELLDPFSRDWLSYRIAFGNKEKQPHPYWPLIKQAWSDAGKPEPSVSERNAFEAWIPQARHNDVVEEDDTNYWRNRRLCSASYHWRYFSQAFVLGDVPDAEVRQLIVLCVSEDVKAKEKLTTALVGEHSQVYFEKLARSEHEVESAQRLVRLLSKLDGVDLDVTSTLARRLLASVGDDGAKRIAMEVADSAPLRWAQRTLQNMRVLGYNHSQHKGEVICDQLKRLAERTLQEIPGTNDPFQFSHDLWEVWHQGSVPELKAVIKERLVSDPQFAILLLTAVSARGRNDHSNRIWRWLGSDGLKSLEGFVPLDLLESALGKLPQMPIQLVNENEISDRDEHDDYATPEELVPHFFNSLAQSRGESDPNTIHSPPSAPSSVLS